MNQISTITSLLKKNHRVYSLALMKMLEDKGFTDLRPSFLEIMVYLMNHEGCSIKDIGRNCGLKKQTMTTHINELEKRSYIQRKIGVEDRREQKIYLTHYGQNFKLILNECVEKIESNLSQFIGVTELERLSLVLEKLQDRLIEMAKN